MTIKKPTRKEMDSVRNLIETNEVLYFQKLSEREEFEHKSSEWLQSMARFSTFCYMLGRSGELKQPLSIALQEAFAKHLDILFFDEKDYE